MSLFAIADTHLSFASGKPMDDFPGWSDYTKRLEENWNRLVAPQDTVVIAGDISWAQNFDELLADFQYLQRLNGRKIILKGNHDYWWSTKTKMDRFIAENALDTLQVLSNNSYTVDGIAVCGSRGWMLESETAHDEKVLAREAGRLEMSLSAAGEGEKIAFLHYPPVTSKDVCAPILDVLYRHGVRRCYYGHLHGSAAHYAFEGEYGGIQYRLISADRLGFTPLLVKKM
ncbi:MAG: metallophosphoesterase [Clostridiales bacterium]|nr:metallophosphoesterase [Clostridiales bacterium]